MIDGVLRVIAICACALVAGGFTLFAVDELSGASHRQQAAVNDGPAAAPAPASPPSGARRALEQASDRLLAPFSGVAPSSNAWVARGVPTLLAFAVYGLGLGFLARWARSRA